MKDDILQRAMFAMPLSPQAQNSGILSGFMDEEPMDEEPVSLEDESLEEMPVMARTPQNPEILMNNLRGDMRSVDARYVELAQMVGEQAAMDTPPEVLAMLMGQLGAQQDAAAAPQEPGMGAGIGGLPQGQEMAPPGMMPPEAGMQGPSPEMMPQGMGDMGPFPSGGAEQAPPQQFAVGGLAVAGGRIAAPYIVRAGEGIARGAQALNQYLGSRFMAPQFTTQAARSPTGQQLVGQARESLRTLPSGQIVQGTGTQFAPLSTLGQMASPTFTQGVRQGLGPVMNTTAGKLATNIGAGSVVGAGMINAFGPDQKMSEADIRAAGNAMNTDTSGIPGLDAPAMPVVNTEPAANAVTAPETVALETPPPAAVAETVQAKDNNTFIKDVAAAAKGRTKADRIRESYAELSPLYKELLGDDDNTRKTQALLLLAEAGFKFAGSTKPTMGMALADAASGLPAGMSALAAQRADRESKVRSAALSQAVEDVGAEDSGVQRLKEIVLRGDIENFKKQKAAAEENGEVFTDLGGGLFSVTSAKNKSFIRHQFNPDAPEVKAAKNSRYALSPDNPFVTVGEATPQTRVTNEKQRAALMAEISDLESVVSITENIKKNIDGAYGGGAWVTNVKNNVFVPVLPLSPNVKAASQFKSIQQLNNRLMTKIAAADSAGERPSVFMLERIIPVLPADPATFFQDVEVNAAGYTAVETMARNQIHEAQAKLGWVDRELTLNAPPTGTKSDPFIMSSDPNERQRMRGFFLDTFGKVSNPKATVYIMEADGSVAPYPVVPLLNSLRGQ